MDIKNEIFIKKVRKYIIKLKNFESVEIISIFRLDGYYIIKYREIYMADDGYWTWKDPVKCSVPIKEIDIFLRNEKIKKIRERI